MKQDENIIEINNQEFNKYQNLQLNENKYLRNNKEVKI